jgi:hypothetical protein
LGAACVVVAFRPRLSRSFAIPVNLMQFEAKPRAFQRRFDLPDEHRTTLGNRFGFGQVAIGKRVKVPLPLRGEVRRGVTRQVPLPSGGEVR